MVLNVSIGVWANIFRGWVVLPKKGRVLGPEWLTFERAGLDFFGGSNASPSPGDQWWTGASLRAASWAKNLASGDYK